MATVMSFILYHIVHTKKGCVLRSIILLISQFDYLLIYLLNLWLADVQHLVQAVVVVPDPEVVVEVEVITRRRKLRG